MHDDIYNRRDRYRPPGDPQSTCQIQRAHQRLSGEYSDHGRKVVVNYPGDLANTQLLLEPPSDETIEEQETDCGSDKLTDEINLDEIEWDDRSDLDINAAPYQFDLEESLTSEAVPEGSVDHTCPETDWTQQHDPNFDLKNYSADDVDCWTRTLSADEFKHLHIMGPDARTESFRQYAISNLNQPTQTLTQQSSSTHEHFEHPVSTSNGCQDYSNYHHHQPDDIGSNNFDQQQLASPDDESRSMFYNHSDDCNSHLEAFDDNGFDDGTFDDGGFDYDGFDDGGFDDGGFDDGGFDDGGFDNGGFDDGYGSTYYLYVVRTSLAGVLEPCRGDQAFQLVHVEGFFSRLAKSVVELAALNQSPPEDADLNKSFSEFLALCLNNKPLGKRIRSEWPECVDWLTGISLATSPTSASIPARCGASLALMKFGKSTDQPSTGSPSSEQLVEIMMTAFLGNKNPPNSVIEGLALLSEEESARKILRKRSEEFFQTTQSLSQTNRAQENLTSAQSIASGLATIILNLVSFKVIPDELPIDESRKKRMQASTYYTPWHLSGDGINNERADRKLLDWLKPTLERNSDLIQTVAWLSKTDDGSSELKQITIKILSNLVEYGGVEFHNPYFTTLMHCKGGGL
ncbi:uncharacterized protein PGTG_08831 [Puccinia graminis f. sp. tritici CRL 75-36-700-3]|uniref:Uncharacterized protein n=1 Tax=Puccinia graminis f. sp. tritici (strain CRL 75-36-700-3 / race SCCL) TaxID=418459 RepID=E3KEA2_PUCGT|nr:uncharacterized protein PGTG_08831 [Puccinia graminis f. sp. tritici CRL 75-36-700-3]EFP82635.1 hypothetical protein PGTG_08831 [Puccinia graminis f. sp. tritici CRL 75-36-700-3]